MKLPAQFRRIDSGEIDRDKRIVSLSFSSKTPIKRFFGYEVLSHDPKAIDAKRLRTGAVPLLLNHDWARHVGQVIDWEVRGGRAYARAIISRSDLGTEILNDIADGIRRNISVGYIPLAMRKLKRDEAQELLDALDDDDEEEDDKDDEDDDEPEDFSDVDVFELTRWQPIEVSIVSVPADTSVGIGRAEELYEVRMIDVAESREVVLEEELKTMAEASTSNATNTGMNPIVTYTGAGTSGTVEVLKEDFSKTRELEFARMREIQKIGREFNCDDAAADFVRDGKGVSDFQSFVLANMKSRPAVRSIEPDLGLRPRETRRYSYVRALKQTLAAMQGKGRFDGFEAEVSEEIARIHNREPDGFYIPDFYFHGPSTRDMTAGVPAQGGVTIQTTVDTNLIPLLRNRMVVLKAGARLMTGLVGNLSIPRQNAAATVSWNTEVAPLTESDQGFDAVLLRPNRVGCWTNYSKQLLAQSSLDVEGIVRDDLINVIAIAQDEAALHGTGTNQPTGVFNLASNATTPYDYSKTAIPVVFAAAGPPTWTNVVTFEGNLETGNVQLDDSAVYITSPPVKATWKTLAKTDPRATNQFYPAFIWEAGDEVNGHKAFATNQIQGNKVVFGKWSELMIANWAGLDLVVDPYSIAQQAEVRVIANLFCDIKYRYCSAFCCSTNSGVTNP